MTNAEMLSRLQELSEHALRRNARAAKETEVHWKGLAEGELDEKPACPFCELNGDDCACCALEMVSPERVCAAAFEKWGEAVSRAPRCKRPLSSKPVRAAARLMLAHVRRVGRLIGEALDGRAK